MKEILEAALDAAVAAGAGYADVRGVETRTENLSVRASQIEALDRSDSVGFGVRVLANGAWGYAASSSLEHDEAARIARLAVEVAQASAVARNTPVELVPEPVHVDSWSSDFEKDPFEVPLEDRVGMLTSATTEMAKVDGVRVARGSMDLLRQKTWFLSSEGSRIDQQVIHTAGGIEATAVSDGEIQVRSYPGSFRGHFAAAGYEVIEEMELAANAQQTAEEAVALLTAQECPSTTTTVVLDGHQVMLQVHESVGHPTELDRVLGMEAAFAGTSFVGIPDLGGLRYGSEHMNVTADATIPGALGTYGYDDEG
ncbi:MAG: TldD/PmbA family protein, partial [Actinomycetota bacterium]